MSGSYGVKLDRLAGEQHYVTSIHNGDWVKLREVDFGKVGAQQLTAAILNQKHEGAVEFYLDKLDGKPFAAASFSEGDTQQVAKKKVLQAPEGKHDVYVLFRGGDEELFDFDWWQLQ